MYIYISNVIDIKIIILYYI